MMFAISCVMVLTFRADARAAMSFSYNFDDFATGSTPPGLSLVGNALITDDPGGGFFDERLRLTSANPGQQGSAWRDTLSLAAGAFDTTFTFQTSFHGNGGADGISFNVQSLGNSVWTGEEGPGAGSLTIDFDTHNNGGDPSDNFVRIFEGGVDVAARDLYSDGIFLKDANTHTARIVYAPGDLDVFVDGIQVLSNVNVNLANAGALVGPDSAYVGFGARTGASVENHDIKTWNYLGFSSQSHTRTIGVSGGGNAFTGTLAGDITLDVKSQTSGGVATAGTLDITDLDIELVSAGGLFNVFPNDSSRDRTASTPIDISPTTLSANIPTTNVSSSVSGQVTVTADDQLADIVPGQIDSGVAGADGRWDGGAGTGALSNAMARGFGVSLDNDLPTGVNASGSIHASIPSDIVFPGIVDTTFIDADLVVKNTSTVSINLDNAQSLSIQNLAMSTSEILPMAFPQSNFNESTHPAGYAVSDLSTLGFDLLETTLTGTLNANLTGTITGSIDLRADLTIGLTEVGLTLPVTLDLDNVLDGNLSNGSVDLFDIGQGFNLSNVELPFAVSVLHEPTTNVDFDDIIAQVASGTFGLTIPLDFATSDVVFDIPNTPFLLENLNFQINETVGIFPAEGTVEIERLEGVLGGRLATDVDIGLEISASLLASALQQNAINLLALPGDANGDGVIDGLDANVVSTNWLLSPATFAQGDVNSDGAVDGLDANIVSMNWLATNPAAAIPEPFSVCLAILGAMVCAIPRRRR